MTQLNRDKEGGLSGPLFLWIAFFLFFLLSTCAIIAQNGSSVNLKTGRSLLPFINKWYEWVIGRAFRLC